LPYTPLFRSLGVQLTPGTKADETEANRGGGSGHKSPQRREAVVSGVTGSGTRRP